MDEEIAGFQAFLQEQQRRAGLNGHDPLSTPERGIIKAYITYVSTRNE